MSTVTGELSESIYKSTNSTKSSRLDVTQAQLPLFPPSFRSTQPRDIIPPKPTFTAYMPPKAPKPPAASVRTQEKRTKTVYTLDTPFTAPDWPVISPADQNAILDVLVRFLEPVGRWRVECGEGSKGKRDRKKRKKLEKERSLEGGMEVDTRKPPSL